MKCFAAKASKTAIPISAIEQRGLKSWLSKQSKMVKGWLQTREFEARDGQIVSIPAADGKRARVALGLGEGGNVWSYASLPAVLKKGIYTIECPDPEAAALGWALGSYAYDEYKTEPTAPKAKLVVPAEVDRAEIERLAEGTYLGRDLVNAPAADLGPAEIAAAVRKLGKKHDARVKVVSGKTLESGFPSIHAVGKGAAADRKPRLCDLTWGKSSHPKVTLVGKGVVFDSGGLDIKSAAGMRLMKKDMGGAASVLALASMIMDRKLPVRLRVLVPTVENAVSAEAFRPGDVITTRLGKTVEVGNTDAEGRLILNDALALACEEKPELLIDFATLTGAARVALGVELPAMFCSRKKEADDLVRAIGGHQGDPDPMWEMPLFEPYRRHLRSYIADLCNIDNVRKGGAITAALFLSEFVDSAVPWMHIDTMAWNLHRRPGRPEGGEVLGVRSLYRMLCERYAK